MKISYALRGALFIIFIIAAPIIAQSCNFYYQGAVAVPTPTRLHIVSAEPFIVVPAAFVPNITYCSHLELHSEYAAREYNRIIDAGEDLGIYSVSSAFCFAEINITREVLVIDPPNTDSNCTCPPQDACPPPLNQTLQCNASLSYNISEICNSSVIQNITTALCNDFQQYAGMCGIEFPPASPCPSASPCPPQIECPIPPQPVTPPPQSDQVCDPIVQYIGRSSNAWSVQVTIIPDVSVVKAYLNYRGTHDVQYREQMSRNSDSRWAVSLPTIIHTAINVTLILSDGIARNVQLVDGPGCDNSDVPPPQAFLLLGASNPYYVLFQITPDHEIARVEYTYYSTTGVRITAELKNPNGWANHWAANIQSSHPVDIGNKECALRIYRTKNRVSDLSISFDRPWSSCPPIERTTIYARSSSCVDDSCAIYTPAAGRSNDTMLLERLQSNSFVFDGITLSAVVFLILLSVTNIVMTIIMRYKKNVFVYTAPTAN